MKKYLFLLFILCMSHLFSIERYQIELFDYNNYFEIQLKSSQNFGSPRYLKPTALYIEAPEESVPGVIAMVVEQDPNVDSLEEPGQDIGCVEFRKGICLPKINIGEYQLVIDEEYYGIIFVSRNKTYLSRCYEVNYDMHE